MEFSFDPEKDRLNQRRHGLSLQEACSLWEGTHVIVPAKNVMGEKRFAILGKLYGQIHAAIFTKRNETVRLISCHRADQRLERIYYEHTKEEN